VQLITPHLALAGLVLLPVAAVTRSRALGLALLLVAVVFGLRFGGDWWSPSISTSGTRGHIDVATWNLEAGARVGPDAIAMLLAHPVDLVVLEELTPPVAAAIESDPTLLDRYPYRAMSPTEGVAGIGLLSVYPILSSDYRQDPVRLEARVDLPDGELVVLGAHPFPARIERVAWIPSGYDPTQRNADLGLIRSRALELEARGDRVLLIGDFNTTPTEPAFGRLTNGLNDAHAVAGVGPGWTWRPGQFAFLGIGFLRIDLILSSSELVPTRSTIDCPPRGDHCLVEASLALGP
jgi:vancomycin resistance protein VanJ